MEEVEVMSHLRKVTAKPGGQPNGPFLLFYLFENSFHHRLRDINDQNQHPVPEQQGFTV
jgi:hypothetical protein